MTKRANESLKAIKKALYEAINDKCFDNFTDVFNSTFFGKSEHIEIPEIIYTASEIDYICFLTRVMFWDLRNEITKSFSDRMDYVGAIIEWIKPNEWISERVIKTVHF